MGGKGRSRRRGVSTDTKRRISAFLSVVLTTAMTLNAPMGALGFGVMEAFASSSDARPATGNDAAKDDAAQTGGGGHGSMEDLGEGWMTAKNAVYQQGQARDVDIYVIAEDNEVAPGNVSTMRLYLKNNTGSTLTDGTLSFTGSRIRKEDGTFTDISGTGVAAEDGTLDDWYAAGAMEGDGGEQYIDEMEAREAEEYAREFGKDEDGQGLTKLTGIRLEPGQLHEVEFEFYTDDSVREGKAYVDFKFQGKTGEGSVRSAEKFYYSIGLPTVNIELLDGEALETGVEHELSIWMTAPSWGDYEIPETEAPLKKIQATTTAGTETKAPTGTQEAPAEAGDEQKAQVEAGEQKPQAGTAGEQGSQTGTAGEKELQTGAAGQQESQTQEAGSPETEADSAKAEAAAEEDTRPVKIIEDEGVPVAEDLTLGRSTLEADMVQASLDTIAPEGAEGQSQAAAEETITAETVTGPTEETTTEKATTTSVEETAATTPAAPVEGATTAPTEGAAAEATTAPAEGEAAEATSAPAEGEAAEETTTPTEGAAADQAGQIVPAESSADPAQTPEAVVESTLDEDAIKASEEAAAKEAEQAARMAQALAIKESKVSYTVEVFGTEFRKFRPKKAAEIEDIGWISCLYELAEDARPGVYYGKVTAKGKWNRRSFTTSQGFLFEITGEGTITVKGELDGTKVEVSGPASSFPEAAKLELEVKALSQEEKEAVQEAIGRKDAPYAAFEMSLLADGETADTKGPVTVKVGNKTIKENTAKIAEAAKVQAAAAETAQEQTAQAEGAQAVALSDGTEIDDEAAAAEEKVENAAPVTAEEAEKESAAPVNRKKGPGADGKSDTGARLTAEGTLASTTEEKAEKETQETIVADSQAAGLALMKIDTRSVQAEELKSGITEGGELQTDISEVMAIYAVTGLEEEMAHPAFEAAVTLEDGVTVTVTAAEGVLPEGVELSVEEVTEQVADVVKESMEAEGKAAVSKVLAYDINLMLDGKKLSNEYWKDDKVHVEFSGEKLKEMSESVEQVTIAPLETPTVEVDAALGDTETRTDFDSLTAENIQVKTEEGEVVKKAGDEAADSFSIEAEHFTVYVVVGNEQPKEISIVSPMLYRVALEGESDRYSWLDGYINIPTSSANAYIKIPEKGSTVGISDIKVVYWKEDVDGKAEEIESDISAIYYNKDGSPVAVTHFVIAEIASGYQITNIRLEDGTNIEWNENIIGYQLAWVVSTVARSAYFYVLKPGLDMEKEVGDTTGYRPKWYFVGEGSVGELPERPNFPSNAAIPYPYYADFETYKDNIKAPKANEPLQFRCKAAHTHNTNEGVGLDGSFTITPYPEIVVGDKTYTYAETLSSDHYTIKWDNIPWSNGAHYDETGCYAKLSEKDRNCWHVNGYIVFPNSLNVLFKVKEPEEDDFTISKVLEKWSHSFRKEGEIRRPDIHIAYDNTTDPIPDTKTVGTSGNERTYYFDGWYLDEDCTKQATDEDFKVKNKDLDGSTRIFYGRYVTQKPEPKYNLTVHKILMDAFDKDQLDESKDVYKNAVTIVKFKLSKITGYDLDGKETLEPVIVTGADPDGSISPGTDGDISYALLEGSYLLEETVSADGYDVFSEKITFEIKKEKDAATISMKESQGADWSFQGASDDKVSAGVLSVKNHPKQQSGTLLPDTGGPGLLQMNRFGWLLLLIALLMAGTEVQYFGVHRNRVETGEERYPYHEEL